jgi:subtilisin family serine protease
MEYDLPRGAGKRETPDQGEIMRRVLAGLVVSGTVVGSIDAGGFTPGLERFVADRPVTECITVLVSLVEQADVLALDEELRTRRAPLAERHNRVITALQNTARRTQPPLQQELISLRTDGKVNGFTAFWIINAVVVNAPVSVLRTLAARSDVDAVDVNLVVQEIQSMEYPEESGPVCDGTRTLAAGLMAIHADDVWNLLGINGSGALVGCIDTGVEASHEALVDRWRGNFGHPATECWLDVTGLGNTLPNDPNGRGTHIMGTMVGGNGIGVAPGAQWIATNGIDSFDPSTITNRILAAVQFMADPDGNGATLDDLPDVVQNSWGVHEGMAGFVDCDSRWWAALDNCGAAGVCMIFSAGDTGGGIGNLASPADRCSTPYSSFAVGATDPANGNVIAGFSPRGPSTCIPASHPMKPEVSAPGVGIYSASPYGGYVTRNGTAFAGPHVAGVVALMRAADPDLEVDSIKQVLMETCTDRGPAGEDNTYGWGLVNAFEAVMSVLQNHGSVTGVVSNAVSGLQIAGASVDNLGGSQLATTDDSGEYVVYLEEGMQSLEVGAFGYFSQILSVDVVADSTQTLDVALMYSPQEILSGHVYDFDNTPLEAATVDFTNVNWPSATTDQNGFYSASLPLGVNYEITASISGRSGDSRTLFFDSTRQVDFHLPPMEGFETGDFSSFDWSLSGLVPWTVVSDSAYEGMYSARCGNTENNQPSIMTLSLSVSNPDTLSFRYKLFTGSTYNFLSFYIDGIQQDQWSGVEDWRPATYFIPAGTHILSWKYATELYVPQGSDRVWVDGIRLPNNNPELMARPLAFSRIVNPGHMASDSLTLENDGFGPLNWNAAINPQSSSWLGVVPASGVLQPGADFRVAVNYDGTELPLGTYDGLITLFSNDSDSSPLTLPVQMIVGFVPEPVSLSILKLFPGQYRLSWSAVAHATSYDVYQATRLGGGFTLLANTPSTSLDINAGTAALYLYRVIALN